jgi:CotH kinase protein
MERFLSFVAMDVMECDWDGYAMNHNNWRLFHDMEANKMVFLPHGLDQMFGVERTNPECPILPHMQGRVARAVLGTPEGKRKYLERMSELYTNVWHVEAILKRVDQLAAVIRRISQRDESLRQQLAKLANQPKLQPNSSLQLSGWSRRTQTGAPEFRQEKTAEGQDALYLAAKGNSIGSWRTKVMLEEGAYRFEGKVRTRDVRPSSGEPSGGAGLRVAGGAVAADLTGTQDWQRFAYSFRVPEGGGEAQVICELRALGGEAWFDISSLRVVRLR